VVAEQWILVLTMNVEHKAPISAATITLLLVLFLASYALSGEATTYSMGLFGIHRAEYALFFVVIVIQCFLLYKSNKKPSWVRDSAFFVTVFCIITACVAQCLAAWSTLYFIFFAPSRRPDLTIGHGIAHVAVAVVGILALIRFALDARPRRR